MKTGVISCGGSNVTSMMNALNYVGVDPVLVTRSGEQYDFLIMPGVGAFDSGIERLHDSGLFYEIQEHAARGKPFLGICLGMQMLFEGSKEGASRGLSVIEGRMELLGDGTSQKPRLSPNIGYNYVSFTEDDSEQAFNGKSDGFYYFLHSYALMQPPPNIELSGLTTFNDAPFCPLFVRNNVCGIQFHPERSGERGLRLLSQITERLSK